MIITKEGKTMFSTKGELYYHILVEMGLGINKDQHVYDQLTGDLLSWRDRYIKCSIDDQPIYAGKDEVIFSIDENFQLFMNMYSHFLDTLLRDEDSNIAVVAHYVDYDETSDKNRVCVKYNSKDGQLVGEMLYTSYYMDPWLCYIESVFLLNGNGGFDFSNFDHIREKDREIRLKRHNH